MAAEPTPHSRAASRPAAGPATITVRAVVLGLVMSTVTIGLVIWAEYVIGTIQIGYLQIPPVAIALLFLVVLVNRLVANISPRARLRPAELVVVYAMMVFSSMVTSRGVSQRIYGSMVGINYFASPANHWQQLWFPQIKQWLMPWNVEGGIAQPVAKYFYEGLPAGASLPWTPWILPTAMWLLLFGLVYAAFMAMAAIMYKLWADEEHLAFPLTKLPLEMVAESGPKSFLHNKLMWIGFAAPVIWFGVNGMHEIWPNIPAIKTVMWIPFSSFPWSAMSATMLVFSLAGVGFFYLLSSEMVFSLWFFFVFARLQQVAAAALVGNPVPAFHAAGPLFVADRTPVCTSRWSG